MNSQLSQLSTSRSIQAPVVFFPGTLCDERIFMPLWQHMDISNRAFVPLQWAENLEQMKALSSDRLDYFDQPVHLVGFSMGGYIASLLALADPQRIASLTLIGYDSEGLGRDELQAREKLRELIKQGRYKGGDQQQLSRLVHPSRIAEDKIIQPIKDMRADLGPQVWSAQHLACSKRVSLGEALAKSEIAIHIVGAREDQIVPFKALQAMVRKLGHSDLKLFETAGHMLPLEKTEELAQYLGEKLA